MIINVTQKNINDGVKNDCSLCPVALAFKDAGFTASVFVHSVYIAKKAYRFPLPKEVTGFIKAFDMGSWTGPFSFEIEGL